MDILRIDHFLLVSFLILSFYLGKHSGFIDGYEQADFDRNYANLKLKQCNRIISQQ